ncbi:sporulation protein Cse60 [Paenibacillus ferrarius]|uniref:sporulation protein Cse60 n=1 Tax=Paenibacillus ferrarius TaxID=1469647 RepID=UPI003D27ADAC
MIQVKEFVDTDSSYAVTMANQFLASLKDEQVVNVCYGSMMKSALNGIGVQRSAILVVYKSGETNS